MSVPSLFYHRPHTGLAHWDLPRRLLYEIQGIFCYAISCPFFFNFVESDMLNLV